MLIASQIMEGGEEMTEVDQEEVEDGAIGLATKRMWHSKKRDYLTKWRSLRKS